jgi:hypothetical protein
MAEESAAQEPGHLIDLVLGMELTQASNEGIDTGRALDCFHRVVLGALAGDSAQRPRDEPPHEVNMTSEKFATLISSVCRFITGKPLDKRLEAELNEAFPAEGEAFQGVFDACRDAIAAGWMCNREAGGVKYGRVIKPGAETHRFSVDVVDMDSVKGPHHRHPNGEIDMIMPLTQGAKFDGHGAGWLVYGPDSAHSPTVSEGRALVLYLLPEGAIEFTRS